MVSLGELAQELNVPRERLGYVMKRLTDAGLVQRIGRGIYAVNRPPT